MNPTNTVPPTTKRPIAGSCAVRRKVFRVAHLRTQHLHAKHVQLLSLAVHGAHIDDALHAKQGANGCRRHTMLPGARLRDDAVLADALRKEGLPHGIVDLVRARVGELLAFQPDLRDRQRREVRYNYICRQSIRNNHNMRR